MDNFYNSVRLSKELLDAGIQSCGTLRLNRGASKSLQAKAKSLKADEIISEKIGNVNIIIWQDKKPVSMITTCHENKTVPVKRIIKKNEKGKTKYIDTIVNKQIAIIDYNKYMQGVDHFDQMLKYYKISRRSSKWTKKITLYFIQMAIFNSFCLYNQYSIDKKKVESSWFSSNAIFRVDEF